MNVDPLPWLNPNAEPNAAIAVILRSAFEPERALPDIVWNLLERIDQLRDLPHHRSH